MYVTIHMALEQITNDNQFSNFLSIMNRLTDDFKEKCPTFKKRIDVDGYFPLVTSIIDQSATGHSFPKEKQYFVFVTLFKKVENKLEKSYIELEVSLESHSENYIYTSHVEVSDHGIPASYGECIYKTDEDEENLHVDLNHSIMRFVY